MESVNGEPMAGNSEVLLGALGEDCFWSPEFEVGVVGRG